MRGRIQRNQGCEKKRMSHRLRMGSPSSRMEAAIITPVKMSNKECTPKYTRDRQMDTHQTTANRRAGRRETCEASKH